MQRRRAEAARRGDDRCSPGLEILELHEDLLHDLRGAAADREQPDVGPGPADRVLGDVAEAAVDLHAVVHDPLGQIAAEQLGHGDLAGRLHRLLHEAIGREVGETPRGLDRGDVLDELVPPDLELGQRATEGLALLAVANRVAHGQLHPGDRPERGDEALALEVGHDVIEAVILLAEPVADGDAHVFEEQLGGVGGLVADLLELLADVEALDVGRADHEGDPAEALATGPCNNQSYSGLV